MRKDSIAKVEMRLLLILMLYGTSVITRYDCAAEDLQIRDSKLQQEHDAIADSLPQFGKGNLFYRKTVDQWNTEAISALDREDLDTAVTILQRALREQRDPCLYYNLCLTMLRKSDLNSASSVMREALKCYPHDDDLKQLQTYMIGLPTSSPRK
jgi:hypothetical protein